ncbi:MAG: hypothetical protein V1872_02300 [bacterium]
MFKIDLNNIDFSRNKRTILLICFLVISFPLLMYFMFLRPRSELLQLRKAIKEREKNLKEIQELRDENSSLQEGKNLLNERITTQGKNFKLSSFMESKISSLEVENKITPHEEKLNDKYELAILEISFKKIPLEKLVRFIYECETNQYPLWVDRLNLSKNGDGGGLMDVSMSIVTFEMQS